jgi:hypothetical protein
MNILRRFKFNKLSEVFTPNTVAKLSYVVRDKKKMKQVLSFEQMKHLQELGLYHIYTLQDILDKLPCFIGKEVLTMQKLADSYTCLYMESYTRSMINITESKEFIDAAYEMLCWCIENGYVKVENE